MKEKAAYLRGLIEGLGIDETTKEGKVIKAMSELLGELAEAVDGIDEDVTRAYDQINDLSDELEDLEADLYEEEDEDGESEDAEDEDTDGDDDAKDDDIASEPFYEVACPNCGETVYVSEDDLDAGEANCAHCGVTFEVALEDDDEEQEEGPVQYEVTCPACGQTTVFEEDDLLDGAPKCPGCGKPLDFEVTKSKAQQKGPSPQRETVLFYAVQRVSFAFCSQMLPMSSALYRPFLVVWRNTRASGARLSLVEKT